MSKLITQYDNLPVAEVRRLLEQALNRVNTDHRAICRLLTALHAKGESHPYMLRGPYRYYREIAEDRLHPQAAAIFHEQPDVIRRFMQMRLDVQYTLTLDINAPSLDVAVRNVKTGEVEAKKKSLIDVVAAGPKTVERVLGPEGVKPVEDQAAALPPPPSKTSAEAYVLEGKVRVYLSSHHVDTCGKATVDMITRALDRLGYEVTPKKLG